MRHQDIKEQLKFVLKETNLSFLGQRYQGKARDNYTKGDSKSLITTDRLSCFDVVVTSISFKGQALTQMAAKWFKRAEGRSPQMLDKEPTRQWLLSQGYKGEAEIPFFTEDHRISIAEYYISSFEKSWANLLRVRSGMS